MSNFFTNSKPMNQKQKLELFIIQCNTRIGYMQAKYNKLKPKFFSNPDHLEILARNLEQLRSMRDLALKIQNNQSFDDLFENIDFFYNDIL